MSSTLSTAVALILKADISGFEASMKKLDSSMSGFLKRQNEKGHKLMSSALDMKQNGLTNMAGGGAMLAPLGLAAKAAMDLESKIADVAKVTNDDFGSKGFQELTDNAIAISNKFGMASTSVGELMAELATGGVARKDLNGVAESASKISFAFDMMAGDAAKGFMVIKNAMGISLKETNTVMDAMNAATNKFGGKASRLVDFMASGGASVASTLKVSGVNMQAFGNAFQVVGKSSEEAATTMQRFQKAILANSDLNKTFVKAGGGAKGLIAILDKAKESGNPFDYLSKRGVGEYSSNLALLATNMDKSTGVKTQLKFLADKANINGSVNSEASNRLKTTGAQLEILKQKAINTGIKLGGALLPHIMALAKKLQPLVDKLVLFIDKNPKLVKGIMAIVVASASLKVGIGALQFAFGGTIGMMGRLMTNGTRFVQLGKNISQVYRISQMSGGIAKLAKVSPMLGIIGKGFKGVGTAFSAVSKVFMANPWILVIMAIAAGVYLIIKHWDKIKAWFLKLWQSIKNIFGPYIKVLTALILKFTPAGLIYKHWDKIKEWFSNLWDGVKSVFSATWEWVKNMFLNYTPYGLVIKHWSKITDFFKKLWDNVKNIFKSAMDWIKNSWIGKFVDKMVGGVSGMVNNIKSSIDYAKNHSLDATINHVGGVNGLRPQPVPIARNSNNTMSFAPVFNVTGGMDAATSERMTAQLRRDFEKRMNDYQYQQKRKGL